MIESPGLCRRADTAINEGDPNIGVTQSVQHVLEVTTHRDSSPLAENQVVRLHSHRTGITGDGDRGDVPLNQ